MAKCVWFGLAGYGVVAAAVAIAGGMVAAFSSILGTGGPDWKQVLTASRWMTLMNM